jgi:parallel beta-helix repeat protein
VTSCTATSAYHDGIHVIDSSGLVLTNNSSTDNLDDGFMIMNSLPYTSAADVLASGNVASGNRVTIDVN